MIDTALMYPDTRIFKKALWDYLKTSTVLSPIVNLSEDHPKASSDIQNGKSRIVLSTGSNPDVGRYVTRSLASPTIRFTAYSTKGSTCDNALQQLMNVLESWTSSDFLMIDQRLNFLDADQKIDSLFNDAINLHFASVLYKFYLSR